MGSSALNGTMVARTEDIRGLHRIRGLLNALATTRRQATNGHVLVGLEADKLHWQGSPTHSSSKRIALEVEGYTSVYAMDLEVLSVGETQFTTELPTVLRKFRTRSTPRIRIAEAITIVMPWSVECVLNEVSITGFSITISSRLTPPPQLGECFTIRMSLPGGKTIDSRVRLVREFSNGAHQTYAFTLEELMMNWGAFVLEAGHQKTTTVASSEELWRLFEASGYFTIGTEEARPPETLRTQFASASQKIQKNPSIGCQVGWRAEHRLLGTASQLKLYASTWFGYHLAKLRETGDTPGRRILRELHLHSLEHILNDPDLQYFMTLAQHTTRFVKLATLDFLTQCPPTSVAEVKFRALRGEAKERNQTHVNGWARLATGSETTQMLMDLERTHSQLYRNALDLTQDSFCLTEIARQWRQAGLRRERGLIVAGQETLPEAFAIVETVEPGLHVFGLLDSVRVVCVGECQKHTVATLMEEVRDWFFQRGISHFTIYDESGLLAGNTEFIDMGAASLVILRKDILPNYLEHYYEQLTAAPVGTSILPPPLGEHDFEHKTTNSQRE